MAFALIFYVLGDCWDPPDDDGVCHLTEKTLNRNPTISRVRKQLDAYRPREGMETLLDFMVRSAIEHIDARTRMRWCVNCGDWMALRRDDRLTCGQNCRKAAKMPAGTKRRGRHQVPPPVGPASKGNP
jgi:hypothetical protein